MRVGFCLFWQLLDISELDMVGAGREAKRRRKTLGVYGDAPRGAGGQGSGRVPQGLQCFLTSPPPPLLLVSRSMSSQYAVPDWGVVITRGRAWRLRRALRVAVRDCTPGPPGPAHALRAVGGRNEDSALSADAEVVEKPAKEETVVENATPDYAAGLVSTQVGPRRCGGACHTCPSPPPACHAARVWLATRCVPRGECVCGRGCN